MAKKEITMLSVPEQVKIALDGRTQRWLALEIKMPEATLSRKMKSEIPFTESEIEVINNRLVANITL